MKIVYPKSEIAKRMALAIVELFDEYEYSKDFEIVLEHPKQENNGDYACNGALMGFASLANKLKITNPRQFAEKIVNQIENYKVFKEICKKIEIAGPGFINFYLKEEILIKELEEVMSKKDEYGKSGWGSNRKWAIEHTSPNPNKSMHLGHLRNNVTGMAISNIWEELGVEVVRDAIDNNRGIAIAKLMWGYLKFGKKEGEGDRMQNAECRMQEEEKRKTESENISVEYWVNHQDEWKTPESEGIRPDRFVDQYYVLGATDAKNEEVEKKVRQMVVDWENEEPNIWKLWEKVLDYSHQGQKMTLDRLGSKWDKIWHEHEHYKRGKELVEKGLAEGIFNKTSDGAVLTNLEKDFNLTDTILIKNDGTSLYITQDLALTKLKKETFQADKLFWVIGSEQSLAMKQVFAVCDQLGIGRYEDFIHLAYGYMSISGQGKMSSRAGNVIYIDELIDMAKGRIQNVECRISGKESKNSDEVLGKLALCAIKYSILKVGRMTDMAFDLEKSVSLEGDSGVYINYSYARGLSVLEKADKEEILLRQLTDQNDEGFLNEEEKNLLRWIYRYPEVLYEAGVNYSPNLVASYVFELCQRFNAFYNKEKIIGSEQEELRLVLVKAVCQIIKNGMRVLGIELVEKM